MRRIVISREGSGAFRESFADGKADRLPWACSHLVSAAANVSQHLAMHAGLAAKASI